MNAVQSSRVSSPPGISTCVSPLLLKQYRREILITRAELLIPSFTTILLLPLAPTKYQLFESIYTSSSPRDSCEHCGHSAQQPGVSIKKCSKCRVVRYCSLDCQSSGWKAGHKFECRNPEQVDAVSRRAVSRLHFGAGSNLESKIYYLRVFRAWIQNTCISGPFRALEETFPNIARNLRFSRSAVFYFDELCQQDVMDQVAHIRARLDADQDKEVFIEIISEQNPELKGTAALSRL